MNHSTYIFGELGSGYTQYPNDSAKYYLCLGVNKSAQTSITLCRAENLIYYVYVRQLQGTGSYLGIAICFNGVYSPDLATLFSCFEECFSRIILSGDILEFNETGDVVNKAVRLYDQKEAVDKIVRHLDLLIEDSSLSFKTLPPVNYSISLSEQTTLSESATADDVHKAIENSNIVRCFKNSDYDTVAIKGFATKLRTLYAEKNSLQVQNKELAEKLTKVMKQKKQFQVVVILGLILLVGVISLFFMNSNLNEARNQIAELNETVMTHEDTISSLRHQKSQCEQTIAKNINNLERQKRVIRAREKSRDSIKVLQRRAEDEKKTLISEKEAQNKEYNKLKKKYRALEEKYKTTNAQLQNATKKNTTASSAFPYLNHAQITLRVGEQKQLVLVNASSNQAQSWDSANEKVACAASPGIVLGIKKGHTKVWVKYKGVKYYCDVTVK